MDALIHETLYLNDDSFIYYVQGTMLSERMPGDIISDLFEKTELIMFDHPSGRSRIFSVAQLAAIHLYLKQLASEGNEVAKDQMLDFWVQWTWNTFGRSSLLQWVPAFDNLENLTLEPPIRICPTVPEEEPTSRNNEFQVARYTTSMNEKVEFQVW